jgi:hypothetical protein
VVCYSKRRFAFRSPYCNYLPVDGNRVAGLPPA